MLRRATALKRICDRQRVQNAESHEAEVGADCGGAGRTVEDGLAIIFI